MSSPERSQRIMHYAGRSALPGLSDSTHAPDLAAAIEHSEGLVIHDPLSFPWEIMDDEGFRCPVVIDISGCSDHDLTALAPVFAQLTRSDALFGTHRSERGLPTMTLDSLDSADAHISAAQETKLIDIEERRILTRLRRELTNTYGGEPDERTAAMLLEAGPNPVVDDTRPLIVSISGELLRSTREGFAEFLTELATRVNRNPAIEIWGVRSQPGNPVDCAVVAFSPMP